jgi:hypothetical protein
VTPENTRTSRIRDWALLALSSASLSIALVLLALRIPFGNLIDRSLADAGWPSSLILLLILLALSVTLGVLYAFARPPLATPPDDSV